MVLQVCMCVCDGGPETQGGTRAWTSCGFLRAQAQPLAFLSPSNEGEVISRPEHSLKDECLAQVCLSLS